MKRMTRVVIVLVVCVMGVGLAACGMHGDGPFGDDSTGLAPHGLGCGVPLLTVALMTALSFLPLTGSLRFPAGPRRMLGRPVSFFQPPERPS